MPEQGPSYGLEATLEGVSMDEATATMSAALKEEGFGVLTTIDMQDALKTKLGEEIRPYVILGACNPALAHRALQTDPYIGLLLPCNVTIQQMTPNEISISIIDPRVMFQVAPSESLASVAAEARERLERALNAASGKASRS